MAAIIAALSSSPLVFTLRKVRPSYLPRSKGSNENPQALGQPQSFPFPVTEVARALHSSGSILSPLYLTFPRSFAFCLESKAIVQRERAILLDQSCCITGR